MMARTPDLSCICSLLTSKPRRESISSWFSTRSAPAGSAAAVSASVCWISSAMVLSRKVCWPKGLLDDHFLEQHVAHMIGRGRHIHAAQQLFLQAQHAGRTFQVVQPEFAQIGLELVGDARHQGLDRRLVLLIVKFQRYRQLQIGGGAVA